MWALAYLCLVILGFCLGGLVGGIAAILSPLLCGIFVFVLRALVEGK